MLADSLRTHDEAPREDHFVVIPNATWADYQRVLELRLDKREIYRKLGVPELWFWRRGRILIYVLRGDAYEERSQSEVLSGIDLAELAGFLDRPSSSRAILEYRAAIGARSRG